MSGNNLRILTAAMGQALQIEEQAEITVKLNGLARTHTFYVIQRLSSPIILILDWLTLNQATLDFQRNVASLHDGLVEVNFNHIARDLSNILITDDFCIILPRTEQAINVRPSNFRLEGRFLLIEALSYTEPDIW